MKLTRNNDQELCILTKPKQNGVVIMYQKNQPKPICSESRLEALKSAETHIDAILMAFDKASKISGAIDDIINDKDGSLFLGLEKISNIIGEKIQKINDLPGIYKMTQKELYNCMGEFDEPENQPPFCAGFSSANDAMGDI